MIKTYTLDDPKPIFKDGSTVIVDMGHLGGSGLLPAKVVGRGMIHVIDFWLVEFDKPFGETYPYRVVQVPHTSFVKSLPLEQMAALLNKNDEKK